MIAESTTLLLTMLGVQNVLYTLRGVPSRMLEQIHDRLAADGLEVKYFSAGNVRSAYWVRGGGMQ